MASTTSLSLRLPLPWYAPSTTTRLRLGTPRRPSPSARLQPTKGLKAVVVMAAASPQDGAAAAAASHVVDVDNDGSGRLQVADVAAAARTPDAGQPKEGGGGSINAILTTAAMLARVPAGPHLPAEGTGGQGGKVH